MVHEIHLTARAAELLLRGRMKFPFRLKIPGESKIPSCPACSVALDQLITHFQQRTDT